MGSLVKCEGCDTRTGQRPSSVYWRWQRADGELKRYYARLCIACLMAKVVPLDIDFTDVKRLTCPNCGIDVEDDYDAVWITYYPPKRDQVSLDAPFCGACAAVYRAWVTEHSADVTPLVGAPGPQQEGMGSAATLRSLGRVVS
jgi:ribosomal protein S27AE